MLCNQDATAWPLGQICPACGHHGLVHPGPNRISVCILCDLETIIDALRA